MAINLNHQPEARVHTFYGYCNEVPVVAAFVPTESTQIVGERALRAVSAHGAEVFRSLHATWMVVRPGPELTRQGTLDQLGNYGRPEFVGSIPRADLEEYVGAAVVSQVVGPRFGVI